MHLVVVDVVTETNHAKMDHAKKKEQKWVDAAAADHVGGETKNNIG